LILAENQGKSGIYLWENTKNGDFYVGSSIDLKRRLTTYFNINHLSKYPTRYINNALLSYGHDSFNLYILEYCDKIDLISREQYYFDLLNPAYNICRQAGSTLGRLHSADSILKISINKKNTNTGDSNHFYGKTHPLEAKEKMVKAKLYKTLSSDIKDKISKSMTGKSFTDEHRMNLSLSKKNSLMVSVLDLRLYFFLYKKNIGCG